MCARERERESERDREREREKACRFVCPEFGGPCRGSGFGLRTSASVPRFGMKSVGYQDFIKLLNLKM